MIKEIEEKYDMWVDDYNLTPQEVEWLIEQAKLGIVQQEQFHDYQTQNLRLQERVQELEEENKQIKDAYSDRESDIDSYQNMLGIGFEDMAIEMPIERIQGEKINILEQQNKRYREALEFYADKENYRKTYDSFSDTGHSETVVQQDAGKKST